MRTAILAALLTLSAAAASPAERRLTPDEIAAAEQGGAGPGTSGLAGVHTTILSGDPSKPGLYTIRLTVPPHTTIQAHTHKDERSAVVVSGTWYFGYGTKAGPAALKPLPPGSFYTEPAGEAHFAATQDEPVVVYITGLGPTDTIYIDPNDEPQK